jgi:hypothetical protein
MNVDRLLREVEKRLETLSEAHRAEVLDAVREEIARERRRLEVGLTVEAERERRVEAETLREVLEAINRQARLEETIEEVLKQLAKIVLFDACTLALSDTEGRFRIIAARGFPEPARVLGQTFRNAVTDSIRESRWPATFADVTQEAGFTGIPEADAVQSWAGIPLLVEGDVIGLLSLDRHRAEGFDEEDLHRARAVAFSAAAAIRKAQLLEQVRRYAALMEQVVAVDHAVFAGAAAAEVAQAILEGAGRVGTYRSGALLLTGREGPRIAATFGDAFAGSEGRIMPSELDLTTTSRLDADRAARIGTALVLAKPLHGLYVVPLATSQTHMGALVLVDPDGDSPDDRLMEAYASRAAAAYLHAAQDAS